ncbi:hypothetical protein HDU88_004684 [Geranomyces variabilis]|nr:hypothetical protein HDU88_004684 [Geranomyces variabilis]
MKMHPVERMTFQREQGQTFAISPEMPADFDEDLLGALLEVLAGLASSLDEESSDDDTGTGTLILGDELTLDFKFSDDDDESLEKSLEELLEEESSEELLEEESSEESLEEESSEESLEEDSSEESLDEDEDEDERERRVGNLLRLTNGVGGDDNLL